MSRIGRYITQTTTGERFKAYVPQPLPPANPTLDITELSVALEKASLALGQLDNKIESIPNQALFIYMYIRKEALLSSQIEGTQSTLQDLLTFEAKNDNYGKIDDVEEVVNYVKAMNFALNRLDKLPLSLRLIKETHAVLLQGNRGAQCSPGEFRKSQNWIGGTRPSNALFVPPPALEMLECMNDLELFLNQENPNLPLLIRAGLSHLQFETIHPFLDGNGRLGRLLITLMLCSEGMLSQPALYLSLYFKQNRADYYRLLNEVRETGNWEAWLAFFLKGVHETATIAVTAINNMNSLFEEDLKKIGSKKIQLNGFSKSAEHPHCQYQLFKRTGTNHTENRQALSRRVS
ncbi:Fic family protein [Piscirickettsia litoralis]|uniref:Fic family protein n=1 Tax=Piscirickettsia litoralis TaxID=1891921 RepID=UPI000AD4D84F|nr:Fic family protein [Piscirickettsia litoralis]